MKSALFLTAALVAGCGGPQAAETQTATSTPKGESVASEESTAVPAGPAAAPSHNQRTIFVHDKTVACEGEAPMSCLQIRETPTGEWEWFYGNIEGFEYEEGNRYELRVEVKEVDDPPADAPSIKYRLIEVVSKEKP